MQLDKDGWLSSAEQCCSPNYNQRPADAEISLLVIHNISLPPGQFGGDAIKRFFQNQLPAEEHPFFTEIADLKVSSHFLIDRSGKVFQFVSTQQRAWHAGVSSFQGDENCNDFSLGIELEGTDNDPYTDEQYLTLSKLTKELQVLYPKITDERITGHCDIAPQRKTDPGPAFDWQRYLAELAKIKG